MSNAPEAKSRRPWPDDAEALLVSDATARRNRLTGAMQLTDRPPTSDPSATTLTSPLPSPSSFSAGRAGRPTGAPTMRRPRLHVPPTWVWGVVGFTSGIIFWHLIGFWSFVSETVYPIAAGTQQSQLQLQRSGQDRATNLHMRATRTRPGKAPPNAAAAPDAWAATISERNPSD